ncbi:MAG: hypothetical protein R3F59_00360 [Myxococcota bacterium]
MEVNRHQVHGVDMIEKFLERSSAPLRLLVLRGADQQLVELDPP